MTAQHMVVVALGVVGVVTVISVMSGAGPARVSGASTLEQNKVVYTNVSKDTISGSAKKVGDVGTVHGNMSF